MPAVMIDQGWERAATGGLVSDGAEFDSLAVDRDRYCTLLLRRRRGADQNTVEKRKRSCA